MNRIEIQKEIEKFDAVGEEYAIHNDVVLSLLSRLETAVNALEAAKRKFDSDDHQTHDGDKWVRSIELTDEYKVVIEALQQIRE